MFEKQLSELREEINGYKENDLYLRKLNSDLTTQLADALEENKRKDKFKQLLEQWLELSSVSPQLKKSGFYKSVEQALNTKPE